MNNNKEYEKAYVELYEIIKKLPKKYLDKIPECLINNVFEKMDKNYIFNIDDSKGILEQDFKVETKALFVEIYEKYLANEDEKEFWENYDRICYNMIEDRKKSKYDPENIFKSNKIEDIKEISDNNIKEEVQLIEYKESLFMKFKKYILRLFNIG